MAKFTVKDANSLLENNVNPVTGLQQGVGKSFNIEDAQRALKYSSPSSYLGGAEFGADPTKYDFQLRYDDDNDEIRAQSQSFTEHVANGTGRLIGTTGTKLLTGLGYVGTAIPALITGDINVMLDNVWSATFSEFEQDIKDAMPIYKTKKYLQGNVWEQMGTLGFWTDDVVDGVAFLLSSAIGAKGIGAIGKATKVYSNLAKAYSNTLRATKLGKDVGKEAIRLKRIADTMDFTTMTLFNTTSEAAFEAKDIKDQVLSDLSAKVQTGELTPQEAEQRSTQAAKSTFWWNMGALMPSNALELSMLFKKHDFLRMGAGNLTANSKPLTALNKAGIFGKNALISAASEGAYEENIQSAVQTYFKDLYTGFGESKGFSDAVLGIASNMVNNFTTDEGQKSIMLGALIGLIPGGVGGVQKASSEQKRKATIDRARAIAMDYVSKDINDMYERNADGTIKYDKAGRPVKDKDKLQSDFTSIYNSQANFASLLKASNSGNELMFNFIQNRIFSGAALMHFSSGLGVDAFEDFISAHIEAEKETLTKANQPVDDQFFNTTKEDLKNKAQEYYKIYNSIINNYGGLFNLGDSKEASVRKNELIGRQFEEAAQQKFWEETKVKLKKYVDSKETDAEILNFEKKLRELTLSVPDAKVELSDIKPLIAPQAKKNIENAKRRIKEIDTLLENSYTSMRELLNEKKQRELLEKEIKESKEIQNELEGKATLNATDNVNNKVSDSASVSTSKGTIKKATTFTQLDADRNAYIVDKEKSDINNKVNGQLPSINSVYKKEFKEDGHTHYIYTTGTPESKITAEIDTFDRKLEDPTTGEEYDAYITYRNGKLDKILYKKKDGDIQEVSKLPTKSGGAEYTLDEVNSVLKQLPALTEGLALVDVEGKRTFLGEDVINDFHILKNEINKISKQTKEEVDEFGKEIQDLVNKKAKLLEDEMAEEVRIDRNDYIRKYHADSNYVNPTFKGLFEDNKLSHLPVIFNGKAGILSRKGDQIIFRELTLQRGEPKQLKEEHVLVPVTSEMKLEELDIYIAKDIPVAVDISEDGSTYTIQGKQFKNAFANKGDAIETNSNGNPIAVTLRAEDGSNIRFTSPAIVDSVAYTVELLETAKDLIILDFFGTDYSDFVVMQHPSTGQEYVVYRKDGRYVVYTERGVMLKPYFKNYKTIIELVDRQIATAAIEIADKNKYPYSENKKQIKDDVIRLINIFNSPTTREALDYPDSTEVQSTKGDEIPTPDRKESEELERAIELDSTKDDAEADTATELRETQKEEQKKSEGPKERINRDDIIETLSPEETRDEAYAQLYVPDRGIKHSASSIAYIANKDGKAQPLNPEFALYVINNTVQGAYAIPEIDLENNLFWEDNANNLELRETLKKGYLTSEEADNLLTTDNYRVFEEVVDRMPIKLTYEHEGNSFTTGLYFHESGYKHIKIPSSIENLRETNPKQYIEEAAEYQLKIKSQTRKARKEILKTLLVGGTISLPVRDKSLGTPNNVEGNRNLGDVLKKIDDTIDLREITIGVAAKTGVIYRRNGETTVGFGSKGNIFLETNFTANRQIANFKLNPSKLTPEHARILYKAFLQSYTKGKGGPKGRYEGNEVTGDLTREEVINLLVRQGENFTKISSKDKANSHLIQKQLWIENGKTLVFGVDRIPLHSPSNEELERFVNWTTTQKNYPIDKGMLGKKYDKAFSIGTTIKFDPLIDNYESMLIKSGIVLTDLDVIEGTKSLTKDPVVVMDIEGAGISMELDAITLSSTKVTKEQVRVEKLATVPSPEPKNEPIAPKEEATPETKKAIETVNKNAANEIKGAVLGTFRRISVMPVGSVIYFPIEEDDGSITKEFIGKVITTETGDIFKFNNNPTGFAKGLIKGIQSLDSTPVTDVETFRQFDKLGYSSMLQYDTPAVTVKENNEAEKKAEELPKEETAKQPVQDRPSESETSTKATSSFKNTGKTGGHQLGWAPFRMANVLPGSYEKANIEAEHKWLKNRFKNVPVHIIEGLISLADNKHAFGQARVDSFLLASIAEKGSGYHEAFHRVSLFYLTPEQRQAIYAEARTRYPEVKDLNDKEIEEFLAEKFRSFVIRKQEKKDTKKGWPAKIWEFFESMWNSIYNLFVGPRALTQMDIDSLFSAIEKGRFYRSTIDPARHKELEGTFANLEVKGKKLSIIDTERKLREVVQNLFYTIVETNRLIERNQDTGELMLNFSGISDLSKLQIPPMFKAIEIRRDDALSIAENNGEFLNKIQKGGLTRQELADIKIKAFNDPNFPNNRLEEALKQQIDFYNNMGFIFEEILQNTSVFKELLEDHLLSLNIHIVTPKSDLNRQEDLDEDTGETNSDFEQYGKLAFESSAKDNAATSIKLLLSILPISTEPSEITGMFKFADYSTLMSRLFRDLSGVYNLSDMMNALANKMDGNLAYTILYNHLNKDEGLKTQFFRTMSKYRINFINALVNISEGTPSITMGSASIQTAGSQIVNDWNKLFNKSDRLFSRVKGKPRKALTSNFISLQDRWNSLYKDVKFKVDKTGKIDNLDYQKERLQELLMDLGILIEIKTIDNILKDINDDVSLAFKGLLDGSSNFKNSLQYIFAEGSTLESLFKGKKVLDNKKRPITFQNVFENEKSIRFLSEKEAESSPYELGDSIFGAKGNRYYTIMQNTYITDKLNRLKKDPKELEKMLDSEYLQESLFLKQFVENSEKLKNFELLTLASMVREDQYDTGREYQAITDLEEYLLRIEANEKGLLTPPTPADRRFYYFYKGMDTLEAFLDENGNIDDKTLDVFTKYAEDEYRRAKLVRKQVEDVISGRISHDQLFETLHFKYVGRDYKPEKDEVVIEGKLLIKDGKYVGKGAFFTHFVNFNEGFNMKDVKSRIEAILKDRLQDEIKEATKLGIVESKKLDNKLIITSNNLINAKTLNKYEIGNASEEDAATNVLFNNMVNTMMAGIETAKVFTGDPASYKSADDYTKRLPGYTSTGENTRNEFPSHYYQGNRLVHSNVYNITTFSSRVFKSVYYSKLLKVHVEALIKENPDISESDALAIAKIKLENYTKVDQTDAQTFITPDMYKALSIKLGEWSEAKEAAFQLLQSGRELTPLEKVEASEIVLNPLKMTYINVQYNNGHAIPIYDKMSMATLFGPLVEGTELEDLYNRMVAKGKYKGLTPIDQVKFNTAEKVGGKDRRELYEGESFTDFTKLSVYNQYFDMLRMQLVTDPHKVSKTLVGSQFKKVGFLNIELNEIYDNGMTGAEIVNEINKVLGELSDRGTEHFVKEFKITPDNKIGDKITFMSKMKEEGRKAGLPDYILESFKLNENGEFYLEPDSHPGNRKWIQTRMLSLLKKSAIDLKLPGNVFIQMSNIGLNSIQKDDTLRLLDDEGYIEAKISVSVFKDLIPGYKQKSHAERVEFLKAHPELTAMAYRIPTQGPNSTFALKIVDFLDERIGDVIVLPAEGTAVGGFDFDLDKLYFIRYNYKDGIKEVYDTSKDIKENTVQAVENRLLDLYFAIALDKKHLAHRTQPLGYGAKILANLSKDIRRWEGFEEGQESALHVLSPAFNIEVKAKYKLGKALGSYALSNVHHALAQTVDLGLFEYINIGNVKENRTTLAERLGKDKEFISEWFSALIDAHVDIAADPYIYYLNANDYTVDVLSLLLRAGVGGVNTFKFIAQPILKDIAKLTENAGNKVGLEIYKPVESIQKKYEKELKELGGKSIVFNSAMLPSIFEGDILENDIKKIGEDKKDIGFYQRQLLVLEAFNYLLPKGKSLTNSVLASRIDTKKFGNNMSQIYVYDSKVAKALKEEAQGEGIRNFSKLLTDTYLNKYTKNSIGIAYDLMPDLTLEASPAFRNAFTTILEHTKRKYTATDDMIDNISNELYVNLSARFFKEFFGLNEDKIKELTHGDTSIPRKIDDIKLGNFLPEFKYNALIRALDPQYLQDRPFTLAIFKPDNKWAKDSLVRAWKELYESNKPEAKEFARDLFLYSYIHSGFRNTLFSFYDLVPREVLVDEGYDSAFKQYKQLLQDPNYLADLLDEFYINAWNNSDLVPEIKHKDIRGIKHYEGIPVFFRISNSKYFVGENSNGELIYKPYIKLRTKDEKGEDKISVFKYAGYLKNSGEAMYYAVDKKSYYYKGQVIRENAMDRTVIRSNKLNTNKDWKMYNYLNDNNISSLFLITNKKTGSALYPELSSFRQVTNIKVVKEAEDIENMDSASVAKMSAFNLLINNPTDTKILTSSVTLAELTDNYEEGFYTLEDSSIVFIENIKGNTYKIDRYGYKKPSYIEIINRIKECK